MPAVPLPQGDLSLVLEPGSHPLELRAPAHLPWRQHVEIARSERVVWTMALWPLVGELDPADVVSGAD
jgi:hypothetical protein